MNFKRLWFVVFALLSFCRFAFGATWEGSDNFSSGISTNWTVKQTNHGSMTIQAASGHASFLVSPSTNTEQNAHLFWNGTPALNQDWTVQISGHNAANWSNNGASQLQLIAGDLNNGEAFVIESYRGNAGIGIVTSMWQNGGAGPNTTRQYILATNADFNLRLVYSAATGNIFAYYNLTGSWVLLDTFNIASFPSALQPSDTFTLGIIADTYYGPVTEGQLYADNFSLINANPPQITNQPSAQAIAAGSNSVFTVGVSGTAPLSYQWRFNATNYILYATNSSLTVTNAQLINVGNYDVVITNVYGAVTSSVANLLVVTNSNFALFQGLIAYYPFNGDANDASGYGNNGVTTSVTNAPSAYTNLGGSFGFDGVNSIVLVSNGPSFANRSFSTATWLNRSSTNSYDMAISSPGQGALLIGYRAYGGSYLGQFFFAFYGSDLNISPVFTDVGVWHLWVCTYDYSSGRRSVYRDGNLVGQDIASVTCEASGILYIGDASYGGNRFHGFIDEIRIYNRALSSNEVAQLYALDSRTLSAKFITRTNLNLTMTCLPGQNYALQTATNLANPIQWQSIRTNTTDTNGLWQFVETNFNSNRKFYRVNTP